MESKLIGRRIFVKEHLEFKNDGSPCDLNGVNAVIVDYNEIWKQYHIDVENGGRYYEVKRNSFTLTKDTTKKNVVRSYGTFEN